MDFTTGLASEFVRAVEQERAMERQRGRWLAELRAQVRRDRKPKARTLIVNCPAHLAGVHKL